MKIGFKAVSDFCGMRRTVGFSSSDGTTAAHNPPTYYTYYTQNWKALVKIACCFVVRLQHNLKDAGCMGCVFNSLLEKQNHVSADSVDFPPKTICRKTSRFHLDLKTSEEQKIQNKFDQYAGHHCVPITKTSRNTCHSLMMLHES